MKQVTIALFTHCQDSFGTALIEAFKTPHPILLYPSTHNVESAVATILAKRVDIVIVDTASVSEQMAKDILDACREETSATLYTHSGEDLKIVGVTHLKNFEEIPH